MTPLIIVIQGALGVVADGILGKQTLVAIAARLGVPASSYDIQRALGVVADGILGAKTLAALAARLGVSVPTAATRPTQAEVRSGKSIFGTAGDEASLVNVTPPYQLYYGDTPVKTIRVHKLVADDVLSALRDILAHYGKEKIHALGLDRYDGCFNFRSTSTGKALSMHAWGIALDFDAGRNAYATRSPKATLSRPECAEFWNIWERHGFFSLGRKADKDWMHLQAARF